MKLSIEQLRELLKAQGLAPEIIKKAIQDAEKLIASEAEEKAPAIKKQYVIMISDPDGKLIDISLAGWVLQIPDDTHPSLVEERIHKCAYAYNETKRGRLLPVQSIGEALEAIPGPQLRELEVWCKTRTPVFLVRTDNEIPGVDGLKLKSGGRRRE